MKHFFRQLPWFLLPALAGWCAVSWMKGPIRTSESAEVVKPVSTADTAAVLYRKVAWKSTDAASTVEWEAFIRLLATTTDKELLWKYYHEKTDSGTTAFIQRRLIELDPANTIRRALSEADGALIDTWGAAIANGWAVHQSDEMLANTLHEISPDLRKRKEPGVHFAMQALTRALGLDRVLRIGLAAEFDAIPECADWVFFNLAQTSPDLARNSLGRISNPVMLAKARAGFLRGLVISHPEETLRWLETPDFAQSEADAAALRAVVADKSPASLMPVLARRSELRQDVNLLKTMAKGLGNEPQAAAWGNNVLDGSIRREFLIELALAQMSVNQQAALDTLAMLPQKDRTNFLQERNFRWDAAMKAHPILERYCRTHISYHERDAFNTLAKTDPQAAFQQLQPSLPRMSDSDKFNAACQISNTAPGLAWQLLQPQPGQQIDNKYYSFLANWVTKDPTAAAAWATEHPIQNRDANLNIVSTLADMDEAKARTFADSLGDPELRNQAAKLVRQRATSRSFFLNNAPATSINK